MAYHSLPYGYRRLPGGYRRGTLVSRKERKGHSLEFQSLGFTGFYWVLPGLRPAVAERWTWTWNVRLPEEKKEDEQRDGLRRPQNDDEDDDENEATVGECFSVFSGHPTPLPPFKV